MNQLSVNEGRAYARGHKLNWNESPKLRWEETMAIGVTGHDEPRSAAVHKTSGEYHLIFLVCFLFMLVATVIERLMPWTWIRKADEGQRRASVIEKAWGSAQTCATYAFMG
jgi:hypothetical protein